MKKLINIGYGNAVNSDRVVAVISADSAPARRISQQAKDDNRAIDATQGRKTKAVDHGESKRVPEKHLFLLY